MYSLGHGYTLGLEDQHTLNYLKCHTDLLVWFGFEFGWLVVLVCFGLIFFSWLVGWLTGWVFVVVVVVFWFCFVLFSVLFLMFAYLCFDLLNRPTSQLMMTFLDICVPANHRR